MQPDENEGGGVADAQSNQIEPVFGLAGAMDEILSDLVLDTTELSEGGLSDCNVTIIGWDFEHGGETKPSRDNPDETYVTRDSVIMHLRIDNPDEIGWDKEPYTTQRFSMPGTRVGKDGQERRAKLNRNSAWGLFLTLMEGQGVSTRESEAHVYKINEFNDYIGLQYHRVRQNFDLGFGDRTMSMAAPVEIFGVDNEYRESQNLPARYIKGQEPAKAAAGKK